MNGFQFLVDENGTRTAVLIDLKKNAQALQDFRDLALATERRHKQRESLQSVKQRLEQRAKTWSDWMNTWSSSLDQPGRSQRPCRRGWLRGLWRGYSGLTP
jgi:hypothetical protein